MEQQQIELLARTRGNITITKIHSLSKFPKLRERMRNLLEQGEKVTLKQWGAKIQSLQTEYDYRQG